MSTTAIRQAIAAVLTTVPQVGRVHLFERYAKTIDELKKFYFSAPHNEIRGWYVSFSSISETDRVQNQSVEHVKWRINGFMAINDDAQSEVVFSSLLDDVRDTFKANDTLGGLVGQCSIPKAGGGSGPANLQVVDFGPVMFGNVLCHGAKLQLNTIRYLQRTIV